MGKPWSGKGGKGHRDSGLSLLHGLARRYQEQQQLTMLGPMLASAGFGQPPGMPIPMCQQPQAMPVILQGPGVQQGPMGPAPWFLPLHAAWTATASPCLFCVGPSNPVLGNGDATQSHEGRNAILSTLTAVGSSLQKLAAAFSKQEPEKTKPSPEVEAGAAGKAAMQSEPTELLHDPLRLATSRSQESGATRATALKVTHLASVLCHRSLMKPPSYQSLTQPCKRARALEILMGRMELVTSGSAW